MQIEVQTLLGRQLRERLPSRPTDSYADHFRTPE